MKNSLKIYPDKSPRTASRIISGEAVVVVPQEGIVNVLNRVGSRIWELSDGKRGLQDIANIISNEFEVTPREAIQDVKEFVKDLSEKGMMVLDEG